MTGATARVGVRPAWIVGLLIASYLTFEHYTGSGSLVCLERGVINCQQVTTSEWAAVAGVPVALLGALYYAGGVAFAFLGDRLAPRLGRLVGAAYTGAGLLFVFYLIWAELQLGQLCTWCTGVHVITTGLFVYYLTVWLVERD